MDNSVLISVIIPVYNGAKYIEDCVNSILNEDFESFEILLIDDGSKDESFEICQRLANADNRIKAYTKKNGGICDARNYALNLARGEYITFADHDDTVYSGFLKENYEYAKATDADIVKFGRDSFIVTPVKSEFSNTRKFEKRVYGADDIKKKFLRLRYKGYLNCVWDAFFKRELIESNNIRFNTEFKTGGEDIDFCSRCLTAASILAFSDKVYYKHIIRTGFSTSARMDFYKLRAYKLLADNLDECTEKLCIEKKNNLLLSILLVRDCIYPSVSFLLEINYNNSQIKKYMNDEFSKFRVYMPKLISAVKSKNKWGIIGFMFKHNMFRSITALHKCKKE